jgi:deazaflavin-dependent oxidoreductase (nitroreductase family)
VGADGRESTENHFPFRAVQLRKLPQLFWEIEKKEGRKEGKLQKNSRDGPIDLEPIRKEQFVYLTTIGRKTAKEHTVELWFALGKEEEVYLSHEGPRTDWMKNLVKHPRVKARIGKQTFEANAKIEKSGSHREEGKKALYEKYYGRASKEKIDDWFSLSEVVRLQPL